MNITKTLPVFKDYVWGGKKLKKEYHKTTNLLKVAESWEIAAHDAGTNGFYGIQNDLGDIFENNPEILGENVKRFERFPLMVKLIDAKQNLSVQVHPSDEYALKYEHSYGKTEMWFVVDAEEGAGLYIGFNRDITEQEFSDRIANGTLQEVLNFIPVKPGEWYFIESGTVHAIGAGVVICEVQQNSNLTYRLYDYGRVGADGKPRELHVEKGKKVSKLTAYTPDKRMACEYFDCSRFDISGKKSFSVGADSFLAIIILSGSLDVGGTRYDKGDTVFIPAAYGDLLVKGKANIVTVKVPKE